MVALTLMLSPFTLELHCCSSRLVLVLGLSFLKSEKFAEVKMFKRFRNASIVASGALVSAGAFAGAMDSAATAAIETAQGSGETTGAAVVACVAALCVVGIVLSMIKKV
ncbi:hypothetical protein [Pseudomonas sp. W5-36]|uniref:hypothetical protein n=1 Tax=Pseudomonas sp. W5-36 TaxID=3097455 RepID=UPI00397B89D4